MRKAAGSLLLLFVFTIPWEYSLDLGAPLGNVARITGLVLLLVTVPAIFQAGRMRSPGAVQWLTLALYLWFCCSYFWSAVPEMTGVKLRGYFQEMMLAWLVWELVESPGDLRNLMRAWLAGSWVLVLLTVANFAMRDPTSAEQIRFVAAGQDPNDVARFLDLGLPVAALLLDGRERWPGRLLAVGYIPLGFACVLLTASRSGFLVALVALAGCAMILFQRNSRALMVGSLMLPALAIAVWLAAPQETLARLGTIVEQLQNVDLNQRVSIWSAGWRAFLNVPLFGHGAGSFVFAAGLAAEDTAHNTILAILVEGGMCGLAIASAIVAVSMKAVRTTTRALRMALSTLMAVWMVSSLAGTVGESRVTWLLFGAVAVAGRLAENDAGELERAFPSFVEFDDVEPVTELK